MKSLRIFVLIIVTALFCGELTAQSQQSLADLMSQRDEYYFSLSIQEPSEVEAINAMCSVDAFNGGTAICYANPTQYAELLAAGYQPHLLTPPSLREEARMYDPQRGTYDWDSYLTYSQYVNMMEGFPATAASGRTCTLVDLGTLSTSNHRRILGVRIHNGQPDGKPKFLYTSTMHGDEVTGMILMLRLIDELCTSTDTRIVNLVNSLDIFIFPCTNPDGTYYGGNNSVSGARRNNGNNVDLNRHFPDFDDGPHPDGASYYQDEAQWMMDLAQQYLFTMGANYHGGAEVVNYPWDTYQPVHPDDAWWQLVSREYANLAQAVNSNYMTDQSNGITNGYAWYTITGSRQDYMNYYGQCRELTLECSSVKTPNASQLPNFWNYNHNSMLTYMEQSLKGVHGVVMDANTNQPIEGVTVTVQNHDHHGSSVTSHAVGDFHRPIKAGNWTFKFTKEGYCSETLDVTIADGARVDLTVYLSPSGSCPTDCYLEIMPSAADDYIMGYHSGNTLVMPTNSSGSSTTTTVTMMPNGDLFSIEHGEIDTPFTLTSTGTSGQYYISYNGYYLTRSTSGYGSGNRAITWSTSQGSNNRWNISSDGITQTTSGWGGTTTYYLFYNNGAFYTGTSSTNNITFYQQTDCPAINYTISVTANPTEGGSATGGGTYEEGQSCTVSATTNTGYDFTNWTENGNVVSTNASYSFTVTGDRTLVANFEALPQNYTVSVAANPNEGGSVTGGGTYQEGTNCTVTATSNTGYTFNNWTENGDVVSTNASYSFTVTGDRTLVANFTLNSYNVSVAANPTQSGSVAGGGAYQHGASCTVTATANNGYTFANWTENGNVVSTNASYTFTVTSDRTLVANFTQQNYTITLSANPNNGGTATGGGAFHYGDNCTITATAANGYSFSNWTENGNVVSTNASYTFTVTGNRNLVANFTLNSYNVSVAADPANGGTVTGGGTYTYGQTCTVAATVASGFTFINWTENGSFVSSSLSYTFTVTNNHNLVAHFTENPLPTYTITVTAKPEEGGTVVGGGTYQEGQSCTVRATPAPGYTFDKWMENGVTLSTDLSYTFTVNSDRSLVAQFDEITYTIAATVNPAEGGVVVGGGTYSYGDQVTLNVEMNDNYIFQSWTENGVVVSQEQEYTFTVTSDRTLVANLLYTEGVGEQVHVTVSLYPNPVGDKLTVEATEAINHLEVFSVTGAKMIGMTSHNETLEISTANLPAGIYVIRLTTQNATEIRRFVKK